jgi:L-arabinose transport system substrate-binding protein
MRKLLMGVAVAAIIFGACSSAATTAPTAAPAASAAAGAGGLYIVINKSADQSYFQGLQKGFADTIKGLGGTSKQFDAKLDPNLGVSLVNDAISAGAKGIAITVPDQTIGPAIAKAAKAANIPLVATDDAIKDDQGNPVPFVGFSGTDMGTKVGVEAAKLLTDGGWLKDSAKKVGVLSVQVPTLSVCVDRTTAQISEIKKAGVTDAQIIPVVYTGETNSAQDAAGPVITAHPDITDWVVFSCNDEGVLGTLNALNTAGVKPDNIIGVGLGAYEACKFWLANQPSGFKAALLIRGTDVGNTAAAELYDFVTKGTALPAKAIAPTYIVHPGNADDMTKIQAAYPCK